MSRDFAITTVNNKIDLEKDKAASVSYTVTNSTGGQVTARARVSSADGGDDSWFQIEGDAERDFADNDTQQYSVKIAIPASAEKDSYKFKIEVFSVENPDEIFSKGPVIEIALKKAEIKNDDDNNFPWWIVAVVAAVLIIGGGIIYYIVSRPEPKPPKPEPVKIEVPYIKGKKYKEAFNILNQKDLLYKVYSSHDIKKKIENSFSVTRRPSAPNNLTMVPARNIVAFPVREKFPVVVKTDPKAKTLVEPGSVVKVYFGQQTNLPYIELKKKFLESKAGMNKALIRNIKK